MSADAVASWILVRLEWSILVYFLLVNGGYLLLLVSASLEMRGYALRSAGRARWKLMGSRVAPSISMLAPAYNESATVVESVRALMALFYPNLEVIVVNDGSKDDTLRVLTEAFALTPVQPIHPHRVPCNQIVGLYRTQLHPNLVVVDKVNGGKADALNAGLNIATGDLVCAIDADTLVEADALERMVIPFLQGEKVVAAGGTIRIVNGSEVAGGRVVRPAVPRRLLPGCQVVEYLRAFLFGRLGWNRLGGNLIISGAFGLFRRDAVVRAGGYVHDTVGEDMELVLRLRRNGYLEGTARDIVFVPDPVAWTEAPETARVLARQRDRWHRGLADVLWRHRGLLFNPRYGAMGMFVFPHFVFFELLAPVVEMLGLVGLALGLWVGALNLEFAALFFLSAYGLGLVLTVMTLVLEELSFHRYDTFRDRWLLVWWSLVENLGYRQRTVVWRLKGIWHYLRGSRAWGSMERRGFTSPPAAK
ncbi:MAG TPA: glycosyltransferase [Longimicrobium sp.]|nr:glycosyltransferase [Longimicrobium sp.]